MFKLNKCSKCNGVLLKRKGKYGEFYGCSNYPKCRNTSKITEIKYFNSLTDSQQIHLNILYNEYGGEEPTYKFQAILNKNGLNILDGKSIIKQSENYIYSNSKRFYDVDEIVNDYVKQKVRDHKKKEFKKQYIKKYGSVSDDVISSEFSKFLSNKASKYKKDYLKRVNTTEFSKEEIDAFYDKYESIYGNRDIFDLYLTPKKGFTEKEIQIGKMEYNKKFESKPISAFNKHI